MFTIKSAPQTENPEYRDVHPWMHSIYCSDESRYNPNVSMKTYFGDDGKKDAESAIESIKKFENMPFVCSITMYPTGKKVRVHKTEKGFGYWEFYMGAFYSEGSVTAGEVLFNLIEAANWPRKKSDPFGPIVVGKGKRAQVFGSDGSGFQRGMGTRFPYTRDHRVAPGGKEFIMYKGGTYCSVEGLSEEQATEAIKEYFLK